MFIRITPILAQTDTSDDINIYFFWGDGCPHCEDEKVFLETLKQRYPRIKVIDFEVWYDKGNQEIFKQFGEALGFDPLAVPITVISDKYWIGFREEYKAEMEGFIQAALNDPDYVDIGTKLENGSFVSAQANESDYLINIPIFGKIDLEKQSLLVSTVIIGFVDGFNPCSLWVLSMLLALTLHSGSRKKIIIIGITFLVVSTLVYGLFIAGVFTLLSYIGYLKWVPLFVSMIAIVFGVVNLKDYFWYKKGISFTISDKHKPRLYQNMRSTAVDPRSILGLIGSAAALAIGVSFIEFSCTAGFPVIWSNLVAASQVDTAEFLFLLAIYMLIYLIDELIVFGLVVITMQASHVEEKHGRLLKLTSGVIMLTLGIVMIINPGWMNSIGSSLLVFLTALVVTVLIVIIHRMILPAFGISIGSEVQSKASAKHKKHKINTDSGE